MSYWYREKRLVNKKTYLIVPIQQASETGRERQLHWTDTGVQ